MDKVTVNINGVMVDLDEHLTSLKGDALTNTYENVTGKRRGKLKAGEVRAELRTEYITNMPVMDRVGPTAIVTNEGGHTMVDDMHDTGRFFTWPNDDVPTVESAHRPIDLATPGNRRERHAVRMDKRKTSAVDKTTPNRIVRMVRASQSRRYGQGDRGLGAKHFSSGLHPFTGHTLPLGRVNNPDAIKPLAYGDRVRHYAKQTGQPTASCDGMPGPVLTNRQWRRANKKARSAPGTLPIGERYKEARYV